MPKFENEIAQAISTFRIFKVSITSSEFKLFTVLGTFV